MAQPAERNPLIDTTSSPETSPQIALHPLVILTISDYVTRRTLRKQAGPILGAILGQQHGREITMEVAFECRSTTVKNEVLLDAGWFSQRLEEYRDVYKAPQLELVGWFALSSAKGPETRHIPLHLQIQNDYGLENAILMLFHPELVLESGKMGGKLPLTLYEGIASTDTATAMDVDGTEQNQALKFRELSYSVETGDAEMIGLDFVARGGGNATAITEFSTQSPPKDSKGDDKKGKGKAVEPEAQTNGVTKNYLSPEDDELITSLTARMNAIKMLQSRLNLLQSYLNHLPPSYLTDASLPPDPSNTSLNQPILRSISAILARLPLLTPPDISSYTREVQQSKSDVELIALLSSLTKTVSEVKELGKKWNVIESAKMSGSRRGFDPDSLRKANSDFGLLPDDPTFLDSPGGAPLGGMGFSLGS